MVTNNVSVFASAKINILFELPTSILILFPILTKKLILNQAIPYI